ncbi:DUF1826 domain-containing protein [Porphyrobacter sp. AAP60]|uniref:DUF1826 domain-containing protein n=1 Tax=Porphyrobacter sp. AAP60 TaxID=1523423 RepID=UPI0006B931EA|nr:DUF1826 domain-containing protein [Porphyrobacter sp. AAP60]
MSTLLACSARSAATPSVLAFLRDPDCNLAIWERAPFADFTPLTHGDPQDVRFESGLDNLPATLRGALAENGFAGTHLHETLIADAAILARVFCEALDLARFELRLEVVRTDSCRKFHADYVTARLITTYAGEGTDWLDDSDTARVASGEQPRQINRMAAFDVGLFKGKLATDRPAIHRSPPIAANRGARLLMVLNPVGRSLVERAYSPLSPVAQLP